MASHGNVDQEQPTTMLPTTDNEFDNESDMEDDSGREMDDEEIRKWYLNIFDRGSSNPMKEPLKAPWGLPISNTDMEKIKVGFRHRDMDDKWDMLIEDPDENGNISLHIIRSWLQEDCYILHIVPRPSNDNDESAKIQSITWEGNKAGLQCDEEQAKKEAVILCRGWLQCEFEMLPHYPSSIFWKNYKRLDRR
jgi:hypothetical protein